MTALAHSIRQYRADGSINTATLQTVMRVFGELQFDNPQATVGHRHTPRDCKLPIPDGWVSVDPWEAGRYGIIRDALAEFIVSRGGQNILGVEDADPACAEAGVFKYVAERYRDMPASFKAAKHPEVLGRVLEANKILIGK